MNPFKKIFNILAVIGLLTTAMLYSGDLFSQNISSIEKEIASAKLQILKAEKMLKTNRSDEISNINKLSLINSQLNQRKNIIGSMRRQGNILSQNISRNKKTLSKLKLSQKELKNEYAEMMVISYKNYIFNNVLLFLFSAKDFNELQIRIFYLKHSASNRYRLSLELDSKAQDIAQQSDSLEIRNSELKVVLNSTQNEVNTLDKESKKFNWEINNIKKNRKELYTDIKNNQDNLTKLQKKLAKIIEAEARKLAAAKKKASEADLAKYATESAHFDKFKGRLPYPTKDGVITEKFGTNTHPIHKNLLVTNNGINFQVPKNSKVSSIFAGVVTNVTFMQGTQNSVLVRHGNYITVYSGLTDVTVKAGDVISLGQSLGVVKGGDNILHFEIWNVSGKAKNLNPEHWLK